MTAAGRRLEGPFAALDDYDVRHVVTHLTRAGRDREVHRLLRLEVGEEHRNGWFAERERRGDVGGYLDDVAQARSAASYAVVEALTSDRPAAELPQELRYALITSSINSLSRNVPPALLTALAAAGTWSLSRALRYAAQQPFAPLRAEAFTLLASQCPQAAALDCLRQARGAAREIRYRPDWRMRALGQVATHAPPDMRRDVVGEALDVLREIGSIEADENVATLLAAVPDDLRDEFEAVLATLPVSPAKPARPGVEGLDGRPNPWTYGVRRFAELLPNLGERARLAILGAFRNDDGEAVYRGIVIGACAGKDPALAEEAVGIAGSIPEPQLRAEVVAAVAPYLDQVVRERVFGELLAEARETHEPGIAAQILAAIAPALPPAGRPAAVDAALSATHRVENGNLRSYLLRFLIPLVPVERLADVITEAGHLGGNDRGRVVAALAARVPRSLLPDLLSLCQEIGDFGAAIRSVVELAKAAPGDSRRELMSNAVAAVAAAPGPGRMESLEVLIPHLNTEQFMLASAIAGGLEEGGRGRALRCLADNATDDARVGLVERAGDPTDVIHAWLARSRTADPAQRSALLAAAWRAAADVEDLGARLSMSVELLGTETWADAEERARELLAEVRASGWATAGQAQQAAPLIPYLPAEERPGVVDELLAFFRRELDEIGPMLDEAVKRMRPLQWIPHESTLQWALSGLFPHLTEVHYPMVLGIIRDIRQENERAMALLSFAREAPNAVTVPGEYFAVASTVTRLGWWGNLHCAALPVLPHGQQRQVLIDALLAELRRQPPEADITAGFIALWNGLIPYLSGADLLAALDIAAAIVDTEIRDSLLADIAPRFDKPDAMTIVSAIESPQCKVRAFIALAERGDSLRDEPEFLGATGQLGVDTKLLPIAAHLPDDQRLAVLDAAALELMGNSPAWGHSPFADYLVHASPVRVCALWQQVAPMLAGQGRDTVFDRIPKLDLFMRRVAGEHVGLEVATAILDVVRWWP